MKHDITSFAQKMNVGFVNQLNPTYVYDSGGVKNKKLLFFCLRYTEC
jgi:methionine salvage enolase-phosphatase E1